MKRNLDWVYWCEVCRCYSRSQDDDYNICRDCGSPFFDGPPAYFDKDSEVLFNHLPEDHFSDLDSPEWYIDAGETCPACNGECVDAEGGLCELCEGEGHLIIW